ncbi:MAG: ATP-binding cassette domain-containing protein [Propioniciclava sp.]
MLIRVRAATKRFGNRLIFADLSADFSAGTVSVVTGPSGCGKTTLLSCMSGELDLDAGSVSWERAGGEPSAPKFDGVAWVPQRSQVLEHRTSLENVMVAGLAAGVSREVAADEARLFLGSLGLAHIETVKAGRISGGERQRLCICRALATRRPILFADEPSANLDARSAADVVAALADLADHGRTVVIATHDRAVEDIAEHSVVLR